MSIDDDLKAEPGLDIDHEGPVCSTCGHRVKPDDSLGSDPFSTPFDYDRPDESALLKRSRRVAPLVWALFFLVVGAAGGFAYRYFEPGRDIDHPRLEEPHLNADSLDGAGNAVFVEAAGLGGWVLESAYAFAWSSVPEPTVTAPTDLRPAVTERDEMVSSERAIELLVLSVRSQLHTAMDRGVGQAEQVALATPPPPPEPLPQRPFEVVVGSFWSAIAAARLREGNLEAVMPAIEQASTFVSLPEPWPTTVQLGRAAELPGLIDRQLRNLNCERAGRLIRELDSISANLAGRYDDSVDDCEEEVRLTQGLPPETLE